MKINKKKNILTEAVEETKVEVPAAEVQEGQEDLEERKIEIDLPDDFDIEDAFSNILSFCFLVIPLTNSSHFISNFVSIFLKFS